MSMPNGCEPPREDTAFRSGIPQLKGIVAQHPQPTLAAQTWEYDMAEIPQEWRAYYARQIELDKRGEITSTTWGLEAGLNLLLDDPHLAPDRVDRAVAAAARRSRYANALVAKYVTFDSYRLDGVAAMEARSNLEKIENSLPPAAVAMLLDAACGEKSERIAAGLGVTVPTFHTRLSRSRLAARKLAA